MAHVYNLIFAVVVEWQTRYLEGVVGVRSWRFESSQPHKDPFTFVGGFFLLRGLYSYQQNGYNKEVRHAVVVEWQTRYLEGVVGLRPWRFESSQPHIT
jgi:hypothetical protein